MNRGIIKGIVLLVAIVALGVAIGWYSSNKNNPPDQQQQPPQLATNPNVSDPEPVQANPNPIPPPPLPTNSNANVSVNPSTVPIPIPPPQNVLTNWEEKLDEILGSEEDETQKARKMAAILPNLPEEGQVEVAQHLSNLVADEDYGMISGFLTNSAFSEEVLDVLIADSLNRPNAIKLPVLLDVARDAKNPKAVEAKEILELFLEEDYGDNWTQWQTKIQEWIANNPD